MKKSLSIWLTAVLTLFCAACNEDKPVTKESTTKTEMIHVDLMNAKSEKIGMAMLSEVENGVKLNVEVSNLTPGKHGFHIHENGNCTAPDFKSAGGHFNPDMKKHGSESSHGPHAGDLPNLEVSKEGKGKAEFIVKNVSLDPGQKNSLRKDGGTALVIHESADDYRTDPSGNSGSRIACGVIK
ncbi:superoxide dismutase family protein [Paenactinomyces guangxiensis]|uniref:Superoxide dismutase [Cu-Zn] n=1 Tax=Paenactinomyces guangxiensis TaxID=1490290 RepID=A0A7W1WTD2_9BACL|nr:superoxide dismutase family protein [Paenactinomyces guangxiensis]MBA4495476.1 superoxide dismutase family protein [Paenactinomyces guangxiensis]MBH8592401.1 superoxide dismutase family protein [Paenactinomyces guangxiensis]